MDLTMLTEGKGKYVYLTEDPDVCLLRFIDEATAYNGLKKRVIPGKGMLHNMICTRFFRLLEDNGIRTHFKAKYSDNEMLVHRVRTIPVTVVVRNYAAGSLCDRTGVAYGTVLRAPITELRMNIRKNGAGQPLVTSDELITLELMKEDEIALLKKTALDVNRILRAFLNVSGIELMDFRLEFGYMSDGSFVIADEITPASCRFRDMQTGEALDMDMFRYEMGDIRDAYTELAYRVLGEKVEL